ncbi:uncharacterized protein EMH_0004030 [Eimeria mitis]|uniref:Transmembrane protein n=1 Tax=Eimeria mitis TaxID=44415 RepID=U6KDG8_9EIME|nr:uncharacterized protein EMH_0004030 [Eimeria mitis]CDJ35984.1 hypothetical protein, conserved [Eimeria mitis]
MGSIGTLNTVAKAAIVCRSVLHSCLLLAAVLSLDGREGALARQLPRCSTGPGAAPLEPHHAFRLGRMQLSTPVAARSGSKQFLPVEHRFVPSFLSWWTSPVPEYTEASVAGEWDVRAKLQDGLHGDDSSIAAANAATEALTRAVGPKEAATFLRVWEALRTRKRLLLSLSTNRIAALSLPQKYSLGSSFSVTGIWQVRRRPFLPSVVEVEFGFPADVPEVILVLQAPLKSGTWLKHVPQVGPGEASLAFSPFFPWKSLRLGVVEMKPHEKDPTVDTLLQ